MRYAPRMALALALLLPGVGAAAEVSTNGSGGGPWSDPATWKSKAVPGPDDDVVIRKGDAVLFDRNDAERITCQKLLIDPKGALTFKTGAGPLAMVLGDIIESYGIFKIDGRKSDRDSFEVRLTGTTQEKRGIKLLKGAALVLWGNTKLPDGRRNITFRAPPTGEKKDEISGLIEAGAGALVDVQRAEFANVQFSAKEIDNTDSKPNEKLNIVGNRFTLRAGRLHLLGGVYLEACDTPLVADNTFQCIAEAPVTNLAGIRIHNCPLADVHGNTVLGGFHYGIITAGDDAATYAGNTIEKCLIGFHVWYSVNLIVKQTTVRACETGVNLVHAQALAAEDTTITGAKTALFCQEAKGQLTNLQIKEPAKDGEAVRVYIGGGLTLLNSNVTAAQVKTDQLSGKGETPLVTALQYLIVGVKEAPEKALVEVRTTKPPVVLKAGMVDPNVTNSPASLFDERTPLPQTLMPLIVKSWSIGLDGKPVAAPEYTVAVLEPGGVKTLKTQTVQPLDSWYRAKADDPTPTVEVSLK